MTANHKYDLLSAWSNWAPRRAPYILDADRPVLRSERSQRATTLLTTWRSVHSADDFGAPGDKKLHVGLLPHPYCGDICHASIFVLLLNPGVGWQDYYGEFQVPEFREALLSNLKQEFPRGSIPFLFLDPKFSWHGGFGWWHSKLAAVIGELKERWGTTFADARACLGAELASIELLPYHSRSFHDAGGWVRQLCSVKLAQTFVQDCVIPRVKAGKAIVIILRKARLWGVPPQKGVTIYDAGEARAAHLTPRSPGGSAILKHLLRKFRDR